MNPRPNWKSWATSVVLHASAFLVMALWIVPALVTPGRDVLSIEMGGAELVEMLELPAAVSIDVQRESLDSQIVPVDLESVSVEMETSLIPGIEKPLMETMPELEWEIEEPDQKLEEIRALKKVDLDYSPRKPSSTNEIRAAEDTSAAVSVITNAIQGEMAEGDTMVVWLLDASISLVKNREMVAARMEEFYRSIDSFNTTRKNYTGSTLLMNSVVAYGAGSRELVSTTRFGGKVCQALSNTPPDTTGMENVMTAIQTTAFYYRAKKRRKERMIFVVITDESGDDTLMLEPTIAICRQAQIAVHVVGPTAVFGAERGSHLWTAIGDQGNPAQFLIPVKRGPDTAFPERAFLPYWHESLLAPWNRSGVVPAASVPWYGGPYRERVLSGVGPYALTRLALETGGTFTILDRVGDGGQFELDAMRDYLPSYGPANQYIASIQGRPLREMVSKMALLTSSQVADFAPPRMAFLGSRSRFFPYRANFPYITPARFRSRLSVALSAERNQVMRTYQVIEAALNSFASQEIDWEYEYAHEESKRWKAWYDLTKGRLLALSVRCLEYEAACNLIEGSLAPTTNNIMLEPWSGELRVSDSIDRAGEAQRLLLRCSESNPGTPWQALADWE
ncbi:MAG: vWA domain-containing protein, partial [Planctomycetota bacterium]